jgi:hypothetical protein
VNNNKRKEASPAMHITHPAGTMEGYNQDIKEDKKVTSTKLIMHSLLMLIRLL